jgi:hypothetical protein
MSRLLAVIILALTVVTASANMSRYSDDKFTLRVAYLKACYNMSEAAPKPTAEELLSGVDEKTEVYVDGVLVKDRQKELSGKSFEIRDIIRKNGQVRQLILVTPQKEK